MAFGLAELQEAQNMSDGVEIDHILLGVSELGAGVRWIQDEFNIAAGQGGRHLGVGTHNALAALGDRTYLEVIAPDPEQLVPKAALPYGLGALSAPRLINWAVRVPNMDAWAAKLYQLGIETQLKARARVNPDGRRLVWRTAAMPATTFVNGADLTGLIPFAIDWQDTVHPSKTAPTGMVLESLTLCHPQVALMQTTVAALELPVLVEQAKEPCLKAQVRSRLGIREIR